MSSTNENVNTINQENATYEPKGCECPHGKNTISENPVEVKKAFVNPRNEEYNFYAKTVDPNLTSERDMIPRDHHFQENLPVDNTSVKKETSQQVILDHKVSNSAITENLNQDSTNETTGYERENLNSIPSLDKPVKLGESTYEGTPQTETIPTVVVKGTARGEAGFFETVGDVINDAIEVAGDLVFGTNKIEHKAEEIKSEQLPSMKSEPIKYTIADVAGNKQ